MSPIRWSPKSGCASAAASGRCWWSRRGSPSTSSRPRARSCASTMCRRACSARTLLPMHGEYTVDVLRKGLGEFLEQLGAAAARRTARAGARARSPLLPAAQAGGAGAGAAVGAVHRLPGAAVLLGDEAAAEGDRAAAHQRRHRLPLVRDAAAVQHGQQHHGLRSRGRRRFGLRRRRRQARRVGHGRWRLLAQRPHQRHRQRRIQQARRPVTIIIDNGYSAATGGQDIPSSRGAERAPRRATTRSSTR